MALDLSENIARYEQPEVLHASKKANRAVNLVVFSFGKEK